MIAIELTLTVMAYTVLVIALFLELICYQRNIEAIETMAFTFSLLLLIVSISISPFWGTYPEGSTSNIFTLLAMIIVSVTTFLNTLEERQHRINPLFKKVHITIACTLFIAAVFTYFMGYLLYVQFAIVVFLICSVVASMIIIRITKPKKAFAHLEKSNRIFAIAFIALVPLYLIFHYGFEHQYQKLQIGFILPLAFILLALNKIYDDLKRLSLIKNEVEPQKQHFKNYSLTGREEEIAILLSKGCTYQSISEQLFIALPTVKTHSSNIYKKCGVKSRHELTSLIMN